MERRPIHAVVLHEFAYTEHKENIALVKDDVIDVLSWPAPCDGPDPKLMFQYKGRVGYIPSSFISGQVRLPPGGRLGRITRSQTEEEMAGREDALHVQADDIIVIPKIPPAEDWWLGEIIHSRNHPELFSNKGALRSRVVKILTIHPHTNVEHAPLSSSSSSSQTAAAGTGSTITISPLSPRSHRQTPHSSSAPSLSDSLSSVSADDNHLGVLQEELLQYLLAKDMLLFSWLCEVVDGAHTAVIAQAVVHLFNINGFIPQLIKSVIEIEVKRTIQPSTFFRDNNLTSHVVSTYSHDIGKDYILLVLRGLIKSTTSYTADTLEIDPHKINFAVTTLEDNISKLSSVVQLYLDVILASIAHLPIIFRYLCAHLREKVLTKFPESKYSSIGGFFFLRFLCPAIVSPENYGILDGLEPLTGATRRPLVLVSKVLQSIANGVEFGKKEPYMIPMNELMQANTAKVHQFFDSLANITGLEDQFVMGDLGQRGLAFRADQFAKVHSELYLRFGLIKAHVAEAADQSPAGKDKAGMLDSLERLLNKLGHPKTVEPSAEEVQLPQKKNFFQRTSSRDNATLRRKDKVELDKGKTRRGSFTTDDVAKLSSSPKSLPKRIPQREQIVDDDEVAPVSHPSASQAGWLLLKGNPHNTLKLRNKWKRFYFLLVEWELHYYKPGDCIKKIGVIDISTATVSQNLAALWAPPSIPKAPNKPAKGQFQFELAFPDRPVLHFSMIPPSSQLDLERWMEAINKGKEAASNRQPPLLSPRSVLAQPALFAAPTPPPLMLSLVHLHTNPEFHQPGTSLSWERSSAIDIGSTSPMVPSELSDRTLSPVTSPRYFGMFNNNNVGAAADESEHSEAGGRVRIGHQQSLAHSARVPPSQGGGTEPAEQRKKAKSASWGKKDMFDRLKGTDKAEPLQPQPQPQRVSRRESDRKYSESSSQEWRAGAVKPPPPPPSPTAPARTADSNSPRSSPYNSNASPPSGGLLGSRVGLMAARQEEDDYAAIVRTLSKLTQNVERRIEKDTAQLGRRNSDGSSSAGEDEAGRELLASRISALVTALGALKTIKL